MGSFCKLMVRMLIPFVRVRLLPGERGIVFPTVYGLREALDFFFRHGILQLDIRNQH